MLVSPENILLIGSVLLILSIVASKTGFKYGVPTLIIFMGVGMLAGSDGPGGIVFEDAAVTQFLGVVALIFILFSGGLDTRWDSVKPVLWKGASLATVGVFITAFAVGGFVWLVTDFSFLEGLLLGAIVSSTDAAAVFSILRTRSMGLKGGLRPLLELESGSNDPMAYFLTLAVISFIQAPDTSIWAMLFWFFKQMFLGTAVGLGMGFISTFIMNRIRLEIEGLYVVLLMALAFFTYAFTDFVGGNGFLALYLCAVFLGNRSFVHKKTMLQFFDGMAWLMQIVMFLALGLLVFPSQILPIAGKGILISLFLMFAARPLAVYLSTLLFHMRRMERIFLSWVGLRGAVPIIFATYPMLAGIPKAGEIFHLVFFIAVSSVLLQGTTLGAFASFLGLSVAAEKKRRFALDLELKEGMKNVMEDLVISENSPVVGREIMALGLPKTVLIVLIQRNAKFITPNGTTRLLPGDKVKLMADNEQSMQLAFERLRKK